MGSILSVSRTSLHALIANASGLFGIVVFLQQMWGPSSLEHTLLTAASSGLAAYLILAMGYAAGRAVLRTGPASAENEVTTDGASDDGETASEAVVEENTNTPDPQDADQGQNPEPLAEAQAA